MFAKIMFALVGLVMFAAIPAFGADGCKKGKFYGSFTRPDLDRDVFGDGLIIHNLVFQLNLHSDGTATEFWTGLPDYLTTAGTGSASIGSWACRNDGKLIVTLITAAYTPVQSVDPYTGLPATDVGLVRTNRTTYLYTITDDNTLTRTQARTRRYTPAEDSTNPTGGTLGALSTATFVYSRLTATDADLLAP